MFQTLLSSSGCGFLEQLQAIGIEYEFPAPFNSMQAPLRPRKKRLLYVYEFTEGIQYLDNVGAYPCENGQVWHKDDLYLVFGTYTTATASQVALSKEVQARWVTFASTGNPNTQQYSGWNPASALSNLNMCLLGSSTSVSGVTTAQCSFFETNNISYKW